MTSTIRVARPIQIQGVDEVKVARGCRLQSGFGLCDPKRRRQGGGGGNERKARHSTGERGEEGRGEFHLAHTQQEDKGGMFHWATDSNDVKGDAGHTGTRAMSLYRGPGDMTRSIFLKTCDTPGLFCLFVVTVRPRPPPVGGSCAPPPETDDVHTEIGIGHPRYTLFSEKASERYDPSYSEDISKEQHSS